MNIGGIVLHKILEDPKHENSLEAWGKIKLNFFTSEYRPIYTYISNFYDKNLILPSFEDVKLTNRNSLLKSNIIALQKLDVDEDIDILIACEALLNEYTQDQTLKRIDNFIDNITFLDSEEIKLEMSNIVMELEEETFDSQHIVKMNNILITTEEEAEGERIYLGINNSLDSEIVLKTQEYVMLGGYRGSGKTIVSVNACVNQYLQGNPSLFFSIEMPGQQILERMLSILSGVSHTSIRSGKLTEKDYDALALVRKDMFHESEVIYQKYLVDKDFRKFDLELVSKPLKDSVPIVIDNPRLTLADIDIILQKYKGKFDKKLKLCVIDYVNQIEIKDQYDWRQQIYLSKQLKAGARKHDMLVLSPYQIDEKGNTRMAKGILDSPDVSMILTGGPEYINFESVKTRNDAPFNVTSGINWKCLKIDPEEYIIIEEEVEEESKNERKDRENDLPW